MTLNEKIVACARSTNGYDGKGIIVIRPNYNDGGDMGEWWIENGIIRHRVTDEDFKQWERDYKLKQLVNYEE
jgi:hypothetical protein